MYVYPCIYIRTYTYIYLLLKQQLDFVCKPAIHSRVSAKSQLRDTTDDKVATWSDLPYILNTTVLECILTASF